MLYHQVYSMLSVLVAAFDPVSMGLGVEVEALSQLLLKHRFFNISFQLSS
jgi:hypothetical protein